MCLSVVGGWVGEGEREGGRERGIERKIVKVLFNSSNLFGIIGLFCAAYGHKTC